MAEGRSVMHGLRPCPKGISKTGSVDSSGSVGDSPVGVFFDTNIRSTY